MRGQQAKHPTDPPKVDERKRNDEDDKKGNAAQFWRTTEPGFERRWIASGGDVALQDHATQLHRDIDPVFAFRRRGIITGNDPMAFSWNAAKWSQRSTRSNTGHAILFC